jgi:hypothetical protein
MFIARTFQPSFAHLTLLSSSTASSLHGRIVERRRPCGVGADDVAARIYVEVARVDLRAAASLFRVGVDGERSGFSVRLRPEPDGENVAGQFRRSAAETLVEKALFDQIVEVAVLARVRQRKLRLDTVDVLQRPRGSRFIRLADRVGGLLRLLRAASREEEKAEREADFRQ